MQKRLGWTWMRVDKYVTKGTGKFTGTIFYILLSYYIIIGKWCLNAGLSALVCTGHTIWSIAPFCRDIGS